MTWFERLTGIEEESPEQVRSQLSVDGDCIVCPDGERGKRIAFGRLETPRLSDLRQAVAELEIPSAPSTLCEVIGDARQLHADPVNANALFQVASQFNLLEMAAPSVTPERGVGIYESDPTQGPACAIACGAGTIYRNYFADLGDGSGTVGQSADQQIDCARDLGCRLGNADDRLWRMQNGYLFPTDEGLAQITNRLQTATEAERNQLRGELRIGLQWQADVTLDGADHQVSQAYCSALPVAYGRQPAGQWTDFAKLVLDAAYEATFCAAIINAAQTGVKTVFLSLIGGGVFGNRDEWITAAIEKAFLKFQHAGLDVRIVSYRQSKREVASLVERLNTSVNNQASDI